MRTTTRIIAGIVYWIAVVLFPVVLIWLAEVAGLPLLESLLALILVFVAVLLLRRRGERNRRASASPQEPPL